MLAYKGFNKDMTCRGFQFKEGETYHEDSAHLCKSGFHACENPMDCWNYYPLLDSEYHEVDIDELDEETRSEDTKICGKRIKIGAKLDIKGIVTAAVEFIMDSVKGKSDDINESSGYYARIGSSGYYAQIGSSGDYARIKCEGEYAVVAAIGIRSIIKAPKGAWITLAEYSEYDGKGHPCKCVRSAQIDGVTLKPDTWYKLENGEFVEVENGGEE